MIIRLGIYDQFAPPKTTPLGITYYAYGMDEYREKRVRKNVNRMRNQEPPVPEWLVLQFEQWATALPACLANWIDAAYLNRIKDWEDCIGSKLPNGAIIKKSVLDGLTPDKVKILLHPEPFNAPILTAGAAYDNRIEVVIAFLQENQDWLRKCDDLIAWELGNWIGIQFGFRPRDPNTEIGSKRPCP